METQDLENKLEFLYGSRKLQEDKVDRIWKNVERKTQEQPRKLGLGWRIAAISLGMLMIAVLAIGPDAVWAQVRAWLIPNYRPISQLENYQLVPEKTRDKHEELTLSLLSVQSLKTELRISILVQGIEPYDQEKNDPLSEGGSDGENFEFANLILENGETVKSLGGSYGIGGGSTEYVYDLEFPPLGNEVGTEVRLVVPYLPFLSVPLKEDWVVSMTIEPVKSEDQVPQVGQQTESFGNPKWAEPDIVSVTHRGIRSSKILLHFDMPEGWETRRGGAPMFWTLQDEEGNGYPMDADYSCSSNCPHAEIGMITLSRLPSGKTYTLTMPRFDMYYSNYGSFYEEDGITHVPAFLSVEFPDEYKAGDFIKVDQWYDFPPIKFHLLGFEILSINEGFVRFRAVMQTPESAHAIVNIMLCVNEFMTGGGCGGDGGYGMEKRPDANELLYSTISFPRERLQGEVDFYIHSVTLAYFPDWELEFDL